MKIILTILAGSFLTIIFYAIYYYALKEFNTVGKYKKVAEMFLLVINEAFILAILVLIFVVIYLGYLFYDNQMQKQKIEKKRNEEKTKVIQNENFYRSLKREEEYYFDKIAFFSEPNFFVNNK